MARGPDRKVTRDDVLAEMGPGKPETSSTLADRLPCHPDTVYNRLKELYELEEVATKKAGARARVFWIPAPDQTANPDVIQEEEFKSTKDPKILRTLARAFDESEPMTSGEIAEEIDDSQDIVYNRLRKLDERDWVESLKAGATSKVWWLNNEKLETKGAGQNTLTTVTLSEALKDHLRELKEGDDTESMRNVQTLQDALLYLLENPYDKEQSISGYEQTLDDPIKVSSETLDELRDRKDSANSRNYEEAIREQANIDSRDVGEEPVEHSGW